MSEHDSFIDEVTEEVRRDKLFAMFRKYGWIGILAILAIVGTSAFIEWQKSRDAARAEALGDQIIAALTTEDAAKRAAALAAVPVTNSGQEAILALLQAGDAEAQGDLAGAAKSLSALAGNDKLPKIYRDIASLKWATLATDMPAATRDKMLADLATPGNPLRPLAMEQQALALVAEGKSDEARKLYDAILQEPALTAGLRGRARDVIVALGGDPDAKG